MYWIIVVLVLAVSGGSAWSKTVYVDKESLGGPCSNAGSNPGTSISSPVCSCAAGTSRLAGGDTMVIRGGSYTSCWWQTGGPSGSAGMLPSGLGSWETATKVSAYPGETVITTDGGGISTDGGESWIIISGIMGRGGAGVGCYKPAHHIRWQDGELDNTGFIAAPAIVNGDCAHLEVLRTRIHGGFSPDTHQGYGFYTKGPDNIYDGNIVYDTQGYAFHVYEHFTRTGADRTVVSNNIVYDNRGSSGGSFLISSGVGLKAFNNIIFANAFGISISYQCFDCEVYNNTVYANTPANPNNAYPGIVIDPDHYAAGAIVRNNIVYGHVVPGILNQSTTATITNNHLDSDGDPLFVHPSTNPAVADFRLQAGSPARNAGFPLPGVVTADVDGNARPQPANGAWDKSAYEYVEGGGPGPGSSGAPIYVSAGGHGDTPSDSENDCAEAEQKTTPKATLTGPQGACTCMTTAGKVLYVRGGTYPVSWNTRTCPITGGTASAMTRIEGYEDEIAILELPPVHAGGVFLLQSPTDTYIHLRKLVVDGLNRADADGILVSGGAHHVRLEQLVVRNTTYGKITVIGAHHIEVLASTLTSTLPSAAFYPHVRLLDATDSITLQGNTIHTASPAGISASAEYGTHTNVLIEKNMVHTTGIGLDIGPGTGTVVQNNLVYSNTGAPSGIRIRDGATGTRVQHNTVTDNIGAGIQCDSGATGVILRGNISLNNSQNIVNNCSATLGANVQARP